MTKRSSTMRNITRIDYEKRNQHGWWVRIHRDGRMIQKFFSDFGHRSEHKALREAKKYRDELLREYPKPERGNMFNRRSSRNTSGYPGINKTSSRRKGRTYTVWQASWVLPNGKRVNKKFGYSPDGRSERQAKILAKRARKEGLAEIERKSFAAKKKSKTKARKGR